MVNTKKSNLDSGDFLFRIMKRRLWSCSYNSSKILLGIFKKQKLNGRRKARVGKTWNRDHRSPYIRNTIHVVLLNIYNKEL